MELLYCSRCHRAIPPGGPDDGKYFQLGDELICPKCYHKAKPEQHTGDTVPVDPVSGEKLLGAGRITPGSRPHKPPSTKMTPAKPPTSRIMPAAKKSPSTSSSRLRAVREPSSRRRLAVPLGLAASLVIAGAAIFLWLRNREPGRPTGGDPAPIGSETEAQGPVRPPRPAFLPAPTPAPGPAEGLVLYFRLDEKDGAVVNDSSGQGCSGRINGGVKWAAGRIGGAAEFAPVASQDFGIFVPKVAANAAAGARNTVAFWMNWSGDDDQKVFAWGSAYNLWLKGGRFGFNGGDTALLGADSAGLKDRWVHVAAVFQNGLPDGTGCRLYLDGQAQALSWSGGRPEEKRTATAPVFVGRWWHSDGHRFKGLIDDLRIYNRVLSAAEVLELAKPDAQASSGPGAAAETGLVAHWKLDDGQGDTAADSSGRGHDGKLVNGPTWTDGRLGQGLAFDGAKRYVSIPAFDYSGAAQFSVALWFRVATVEKAKPSGPYRYFFSHSDGLRSHSVNAYMVFEPEKWGVVRTIIRGAGSAGSASGLDTPGRLDDGKWHHYALVSELPRAKVYIDGQVQVVRGEGIGVPKPAGPVFLGGRCDLSANRFFVGALDDVRVYDRALSAEEIAKLAGPSAPEASAPPGRK